MKTAAVIAIGSAVIALCGAAAVAEARCPVDGSPSVEVCRYSSALLMPSAFAALYAPRGDGLGTFTGGGLEVVLFTWSDSSESFGPGQGKLHLDVALLRSSEDAPGLMTQFSGGVTLAFERNASRSWLIPTYAVAGGALRERNLATRGFVDGGLGVYLYYSRRLIVDARATYLIPWSDPDELAGFRAKLAVSAALW
jgi:hypothetical protein